MEKIEYTATFMEYGKVTLEVMNEDIEVLFKIAFDRISKNDQSLKQVKVLCDLVNDRNYWFVQSETCEEHALIRKAYDWD